MGKKEFSAAELKAKLPTEWKKLQVLALKQQKPEFPEKLRRKLMSKAEALAKGKECEVDLPEYGFVASVNLGMTDGGDIDLYLRKIKPLGKKVPSRFKEVEETVVCGDVGESIRELAYRKLRQEINLLKRESASLWGEIDNINEQYNVDSEELACEVDNLVMEIRDNL